MPDFKEFLSEKIKEFQKYPSKEEFALSFKTVLDFVKKAVEALNKKYDETVARIENLFSVKAEEINRKVDTKLAQVKDGKDGKNGVDGIDGTSPDPQEVAQLSAKIVAGDVLPKIPTIEAINDNLSKQGDLIVDILSKQVDEKKLHIEDIWNLPELLDELRQLRTRTLGGGGGFSASAMNIHHLDKGILGTNLIDSGDHINFTISPLPNPVSSFVLVRSRAEQIETEDYTLTGNALVLTVAFDPTTETIYYKCRI